MKTVFKSSEIAHVWAHKGAEHGTCPSAMSFNGDAFSSYGTEIAQRIERKGKVAYIVNETSYSVTTSSHQGSVRAALVGETVFRIGGIHMGSSLRDVSGAQLFDYAINEAATCQAKAAKARKADSREWSEARQGENLERAKAISEWFGLRRKVDTKTINRLAASKAKAEKIANKARAIREANERAKQSEAFEAWKRNEEHEYFNARIFPVSFRVESDELVSTLGARVPLDSARVAFRFALSRRATGWHRNGETCPVGHYQLDVINPQGIVAGCHRIEWAEVERLASVLA